jgi:hypothetical protein
MIYELIVCSECDDVNTLTICKVPLHQIVEKEIHIVKCQSHHKTLAVSDSQKFENLIYISFVSYKNNFYHQAIINMSTAYENLQEFIITAILKKNNTESIHIEDSLKKMKLSERRLGGFYYLFLNEFGSIPKLPNQNKEIRLRNDVVHNGYFCTKEETLNYIFEMYKLVLNTIHNIENSGFKILDLIINTTTLQSKEIKDLREIYIHSVDFHTYLSTRYNKKEEMTIEDFLLILNRIPNYEDLVISKTHN